MFSLSGMEGNIAQPHYPKTQALPGPQSEIDFKSDRCGERAQEGASSGDSSSLIFITSSRVMYALWQHGRLMGNKKGPPQGAFHFASKCDYTELRHAASPVSARATRGEVWDFTPPKLPACTSRVMV